jgi:hypothetical protein
MEGMQLQVLKNQADAIRMRVDEIRMQIELLKQLENVYVWRTGQDKYDAMIVFADESDAWYGDVHGPFCGSNIINK